jgi:alkylated DNA repair dioxygenase AlkB
MKQSLIAIITFIWCWTFFFLSAVAPGDGFAAVQKPRRGKKVASPPPAHASEPIDSKNSSKSLVFELQKCATPSQVLQNVAPYINPSVDPSGNVASLVLIRLAKQCISLENDSKNDKQAGQRWKSEIFEEEYTSDILKNIVNSLAVSALSSPKDVPMNEESLDPVVEGTKALAILARLMPEFISENTYSSILKKWSSMDEMACSCLEGHQLSGLHWAYHCFQHLAENSSRNKSDSVIQLPNNLQKTYESLNLPFRIIPGCFEKELDFSVDNLRKQVDFQVDTIKTTSNQVVQERRQTAWQGDEGVAPFEYSGKAMPRMPWSPLVRSVRDGLVRITGEYYDGCLLNLYPDGGSAMRYHIDPDQGTLWDHSTAVVSVGATRRVAFRDIPDKNGKSKNKPHNFVVMHGDVMEMVEDCQQRYQHAVKPADNKREQTARSSLVFKRSLTR